MSRPIPGHVMTPDARSPITGWGRSHWEDLADRLLVGARRHSSPGGARVVFPSSRPQDDTDQLEGFARSFLLAALRIAGSRGDEPELLDWYGRALAAGVDPRGSERWPALADHGQPTVEATAIALGLHLSRPWLWQRLAPAVQERLLDWLGGSGGSWGADNNHVLFSATIQAFLASVGAGHDGVGIEAALDRIEDWYAGDGWYSDGEGRRFDHYNAWTFQLYPFFITEMLSGSTADTVGSQARLVMYRQRLDRFLTDYQHLFATDGSPLIQGRSLIYRWGVVAPFWMGELQGASPLPPGRTRRLASSVARHFTDHGVASDGVASLGWWGGNPGMLQAYNAPGSPLWLSKGFLGLLLPPDHPVWTDTEEPLELERADIRRVLSGPQWLVHGSRADGIVRTLNFGSAGHPRKDDPYYRRLAFSTATAPVQQGDLRDNDIYVPLGQSTSTHRGPTGGVARPHGGSQRFRLDAAGRDVQVDYATAFLDPAVDTELRVARVRGLVMLPLRLSGYAISSDREMGADASAGAASAHDDDGLSSGIALVDCRASELPVGNARPGIRPANGSPLGRHTAVPVLDLPAGPHDELVIAWLVRLSRHPDRTDGKTVPGCPALPAPPVISGGATAATDLAALAGKVRMDWRQDGAVAMLGDVTRTLTWIRSAHWPADFINQGVFRAGG